MNFEDLNLEQSYTPMKAYCQSKLANVLFCKELARRLGGKAPVASASVQVGLWIAESIDYSPSRDVFNESN
jgi:NAD(P)-dependent dehydrogenase (short-subunit alcohol dehydrogenase family)